MSEGVQKWGLEGPPSPSFCIRRRRARTGPHPNRAADSSVAHRSPPEYPRRMVLITGATGHIGANLVRLLCGTSRVRVMVRGERLGLDGLPLEVVPGDVTDASAVRAAVQGVELVYHLAAKISITGSQGGKVEAVNVGGARNVAEACLTAGVRRLVHVSSVHAFHHDGGPLDETAPRPTPEDMAYDRSKAAGEAEVRAVIARGLDAVIANPTGVIGPDDYRPSRAGQSLIDLAEGRVPVTVDGGFDWVDVRDVAASLVAASTRGRTGENYILGGRWASMIELAQLVSRWSGRAPPSRTVPRWLLHAAAPLAELGAKLIGREPTFTSEALHTMEHGSRAVSSQKAIAELGHAPRPLEETVRDTLDFFRAQGRLR